MATTVPRPSFLASTSIPGVHNGASAPVTARRRRRLDRESGQAIEILGHAIQYLADEFALECLDPAQRSGTGPNRSPDPRMQAIELLMAFNRQIYMSCPVVPTLAERLRSCLRRELRA